MIEVKSVMSKKSHQNFGRKNYKPELRHFLNATLSTGDDIRMWIVLDSSIIYLQYCTDEVADGYCITLWHLCRGTVHK